MTMESRWEEFYLGSRRFLFLADRTGLPIDQINFVLGQIAALTFAYLFRVYMHPTNATPKQRHLAALAAGTFISYFCFGKQILLAILLVCICYLLLLLLPAGIVHHATLCAAMTFLSVVHIQRQFLEDGVYVVDITGPLMIMVQKATSLSYSLYDGCSPGDKQLTALQKKHQIREKPTMLEYFSYLMCFQSVLSGPFFMFTDYQDFIQGTHYVKYASIDKMKTAKKVLNNNYKYTRNCQSDDPNPTSAATKKVYVSFVCALVLIFVRPLFPYQYLTDPSFYMATFWYKLFYIIAVTMGARQLYYTAWYLGDAVCTMSGLGFNGYDANGKAKWDLITTVDIIGVEFGTSWKTTLESWNITTMLWLRFLVYERMPYQGTLATYALSCLWHGFYPGYYLTFFSGAFFTFVSRAARRLIRPIVLLWGDKVKKCYDVVTFLITRLILSYVTFPFVILRFWASLHVYWSMWFYLHIIGLICVFVMPMLMPYTKKFRIPKESH